MSQIIQGVYPDKPNSQTVLFNGVYINVSAIARQQMMDQSYLSSILRGRRQPSIKRAMQLAGTLGLTLDEFMAAIQEHVRAVEEKRSKLEQQHVERVLREDKEDMDTLRKGRTPKPRLPGQRIL